jgi:hypothetical protein
VRKVGKEGNTGTRKKKGRRQEGNKGGRKKRTDRKGAREDEMEERR